MLCGWDTKTRMSHAWAISELLLHEPAHLSVIGGVFILESVIRYTALVRYSEFGGCPLFGSRKCIASTGIKVGTSTVNRGGPLLGGSVIRASTVCVRPLSCRQQTTVDVYHGILPDSIVLTGTLLHT